MARTHYDTYRTIIANWFIVSFVVLLTISAVVSKFFQNPISTAIELERFQILIPSQKLINYNQVEINNSLGSFSIGHDGDSLNWDLLTPKRLKAKDNLATKIFEAISELKISKIYTKDPINLSNFSLDRPLYSLQLFSKTGPQMKLTFGLKNSIEDTTYVTLEGVDAIYQIKNPSVPFESLSFSGLIDSRIFPFTLPQIKSLTFKKDDQIKIQLLQENHLWFNNKKQEMDLDKIKDYFSTITNLKSQIILDERTKELEEKLQELFKKSNLTLIFDLHEGVKQYFITSIVKTPSMIKTDLQNCYFVQDSENDNIYLMEKESYEAFIPKEKQLMQDFFKRLFY